MGAMLMKICIYTKSLSENYDEGVNNVARTLIEELSKKNDTIAIFREGNIDSINIIKKIKSNKFLLSFSLMKEVRKFRPELIIYIPRASATIYNLFCINILKYYAHNRNCRTAMLVLQPNEFNALTKNFAFLFAPSIILAPSSKIYNDLVTLRFTAKLIRLGIDTKKFTPVEETKKLELRKKYGLCENAFIVLHVGHLSRNRGLDILKNVQNRNAQVLLVSSASTPKDEKIRNDLTNHGIETISQYIPNIEEIYQLSDCYIFPVRSETGAIAVPLSVLEAMSCNLPVVSTKFHGLTDIFSEKNGFLYASSIEEFILGIEKVRLKKIKLRAATPP